MRRAEHNNGSLTTLQEIALHQQGIERIELVNQLCRHLRTLYLQNNLICRIEKLHRLKVRRGGAWHCPRALPASPAPPLARRRLAPAAAPGRAARQSARVHTLVMMAAAYPRPVHPLQELEHLNLALNNIQRVQNLQRCESLRRLDLTANFVDTAGLLSLRRWVLAPRAPALAGLHQHAPAVQRVKMPCSKNIGSAPSQHPASPLPPCRALPAACGRMSSWRSFTCWATPAPAGQATGRLWWPPCHNCSAWTASRWAGRGPGAATR